MNVWRWALGGLVALTTATGVAHAGEAETSLSGFSDLTYSVQRGKRASSEQWRQFEALGEEAFAKSSNEGFGLVGTDFVLTTELDDKWVYLAEVNLQVARGGQSELELDVERMFLEYRIRPQFNLQAGLFFTPVGYFNRNLYARAWMMVSAQVPDLFEEELGLVPTHTVGVQAHGMFDIGADHRLSYAVSLGNGRTRDPVNNVYARDDDGWRSMTGMVEWMIPALNGITIGASGWYDRISTFYLPNIGGSLSIVDPTAQGLRLQEIGGSAHFVLASRWLNVIAEGLIQRHSDRDNVLGPGERSMVLKGALVETSANLLSTGALKPYVRLDLVKLPSAGGGAYLGLRADGDEMTRVFLPQTQMAMTGVAYDVAPRVRLKVELSFALDGVRKRTGILGQTAFAF